MFAAMPRELISWRFSFITTVDFTSRPLIPMASARCSSAARRISPTGCLMPMFTTSYPLLDRMMSTRFLPMSWTSPLTVASTIVALLSRADPSALPSMYGSRYATAVFITSADCSTNGSCISPRPKSSPTTRMPSSRFSLMMSSADCPESRAAARSSSRPLRSPSTIRRASRSASGSAASSSARPAFTDAASTPSNSSR